MNEQSTDFYGPSSPAGAIAVFFAGLVLLIAFVAGMIANWHWFIGFSSAFVRVLVILAGSGLCLAVMGYGAVKAYMAWLTLQHAREDLRFKQDENRRADERHSLELYLAESRLLADERGNRPFVFDRQTSQVLEVASGNYVQPVSTTYSPRIEISSSNTSAQGQAAGAGQAPGEQPTLETIIEELTPNALEFAYGLDPLTGQLVKTVLNKAVHIQLIGISGQGKSRQATSILTQLCSRNDPDHLRLALIDCEGETTAPFQRLPHVRIVADEPKTAAQGFRSLVKELERRDVSHLAFPVILMFVEEFLNLRRTMPTEYRDEVLENYTTLALRGRKRGMFLFSIGQTSYTERSIRDAQNQFLSSMAFATKPTAARASGFTNTELLNRLYSERRPGQFLLERPAGDAILLAPYVDTSAIPGLLNTAMEPITQEVSDVVESRQRGSSEVVRNLIDPALQAKLEQVRSLLASGVVNKAEIILGIWGAKSGSSEKYKQAEQEFKAIMAHIAQRS